MKFYLLQIAVPKGTKVTEITDEFQVLGKKIAVLCLAAIQETDGKTACSMVVRVDEPAATSGTAATATANDVPAAPMEGLKARQNKEQAAAILTALDTTHWNRKAAADLLKMDYKALLYKMNKLGLSNNGKCA